MERRKAPAGGEEGAEFGLLHQREGADDDRQPVNLEGRAHTTQSTRLRRGLKHLLCSGLTCTATVFSTRVASFRLGLRA